MKRIAYAIVLLPFAATAEPVLVRTAEHGDFTRVVLDFAEPADWRITPGEGEVRIETGDEYLYDLSDAYRRIGRDRIGTLRQTGPRELTIELACNCAPSAFELGGGLVIDIAPGVAEPQAPPPAPVRAASPVRLPAGMVLPGLLTAGVEAETETPAPDRSARAEALRARLMADIGAMTGGVAADPAPVPEPNREENVVEALPSDEPEPPEQMDMETRAQLDDRGYDRVPPLASCPAFAEETLADWANARKKVPPESGRDAWARAEARRLIATGFGIEAQRLIEIAGFEDREATMLHEIAGLMDAEGPGPQVSPTAECGDLLSLFALIADPPVTPSRIGSILDALAAAPPATRSVLQRRAIGALMALGRDEDARLLAGAGTRRDTPKPPPDLTSLAFESGGAPVSEDGLRDIVARRTPEAAEAIRRLISSMNQDGARASPGLLDQARALLPELDGKERDLLEREVIRSEIAARNFSRAAREIDAFARRNADMAAGLDADLAKVLLDLEEDAVFLTQVVRLADRPVADPEVRLGLAARAAENHVPKLALRILSHGEDVPGTEERLLRANIALDMDELDTAETHLTGLPGEEADAMRKEIDERRLAMVPPEPEPAPPPATGLRARSSNLIEKSAALRAELESFLSN